MKGREGFKVTSPLSLFRLRSSVLSLASRERLDGISPVSQKYATTDHSIKNEHGQGWQLTSVARVSVGYFEL